jgi:hypothetical protein
MNLILRARKRDTIFFLAVISALFAGILWMLVEAGLNRGDLFSMESIFLFGAWILLYALVLYGASMQKVELTESDLIYTSDYLVSSKIQIVDITAVNVTYGEKMRRQLTVLTRGNASVVIPLGIWTEGDFVKLFKELKRRNSSIDFDDRYDGAINAFGTSGYETEIRSVASMHNADVGKWALLVTISAAIPLVFLIISSFF